MNDLKILFERAKIKYIISVDDCYNTDKTLDEFTISQFLVNHTESAISFFREIGVQSFEETLNSVEDDGPDYIETLVADLDEQQCGIFKNKYYTMENEEKNALEAFCQELKEKEVIIDYYKLSSIKDAEEFNEKLEDYFTVDQENRVLWMIDNDFQKVNGSSEDGIKLISKFISFNNQNNIYALTSAQISNLTDNDAFRSNLNNDNYSEALLSCVIHKHNIINKEYSELYQQMYAGFRENYSGTIINQLRSSLSSAAETSGNTIKSIKEEAIHNVFVLSSKSEGVSPLETFQRLMLVILKTEIANQLSGNYDHISKLIYDYSNLCLWGPNSLKGKDDFEKIQEIRKNECYDITVNNLYSPVSYGDIFKISKKYYLLISQSCNVVVRNSGERKAQCATLVEIECLDKSDKSHQLLKYFVPNEKYCVSYNRSINIDFTVLDLCSLNQSGKLELSNSFNLEIVLHRYTDGMITSLRHTINHNRILIDNYQQIVSNKDKFTIDEIITKVREIYKDNTTELVANFSDGVSYNGERIKRLDENMTDDICKRYCEYHSRKGLNFDFAADYKLLKFKVKYDFNFENIGLSNDNIKIINNYDYYLKEKLDNKQIKSKVINEFLNYYNKEIMKSSSCNTTKFKVDIEAMAITLEAKSIPVNIDNIINGDVINVNNDIITIKIPKTSISSLIKSSQNNTYEDIPNCKKIKVSQNNVSFDFEIGQPFYVNNLNVFTKLFKIEFVDKDIILLKITCSE